MKIYEIIFSPTGGTKKVADIISAGVGADSICIDLTDKDFDFASVAFGEEDVCIAALPSYGGRIPRIAGERLKQMKGNRARVISVTVYGNAAVAEHSIMHQFAAGRPDAEDRKELAGFADRIRREIQAGGLRNVPAVPGNRPYRTYGGVPMKPRSGRSCTKCKVCAAKCPVGAIPADMPMSTDHDRCITCMRCIKVCPQKNRSVSKVLVAAGAQKLKKACKDRKKNELFWG